MDKQIKDLTDLELAQAIGETYQGIINLNNQLEALRNLLIERKPKVEYKQTEQLLENNDANRATV